ncbi:hypothetical protein L21SP5_00780 [Salinivirga cyanobacteriivorans]|uniref:Uncharacterized protein n=1 Tax=Salinivirga cyanobacteriivorans TaxID=1307839 RepID=A0A0S2HWK5_9BACT|nr:hypothetical protein [Salinivirga cyanobacteriivorans]ALO14451.1 hypothetical protein L21SP5_00780 [Salinivirga cyanobacteriivorans]
MRLFCLALLFILIKGCHFGNADDIKNGSSNSVDIESYRTDAIQLYQQEIINNPNHPNYSEPILNHEEIDRVFELINAVYELDIPERDTVFAVYEIHTRCCIMMNGLSLKVQTDAPEVQNMVNGVTPTGNALLDSLLNIYAFDSVKLAYSYPEFPWLTLYTQEIWNMIPIAHEFEQIDAVLLSDLYPGCVGDGNTITMERNNDFAKLTFSIGWGDCPAGCINHRYWEFRVIGGAAEFIQAYEN